MADREIKISFPDVKMEALEFFLRENNVSVEDVLKEHLDKTYEKNVPAQVRKFVESRMEEPVPEQTQETGIQRQGRRGRQSNRQNNTEEQSVAGAAEEEDQGMAEDSTETQENAMTMQM